MRKARRVVRSLISRVFPPTPPPSVKDEFSPSVSPGTQSPLSNTSQQDSIIEETKLEKSPPSSISRPESIIEETKPKSSSLSTSQQESIIEETKLETLDFPLPPPSKFPTETHELDADTPDAHVKRDPRLIRLTGVHPFNVEAPLTDLFNSGIWRS